MDIKDYVGSMLTKFKTKVEDKFYNKTEIDTQISALAPLQKRELDYANITLSANQTTNLTANSLIAFDTLNFGNMKLNNNKVSLKANRSYSISSELLCATTGYCEFGLYNETDGVFINNAKGESISTTYATGYASSSSFSSIVKFDKDIDVSLRIILISNTTIISNLYTHWNIQEIASVYNTIAETVLFDGVANAVSGVYNLSDDIRNYDKLTIYTCCVIGGVYREKHTLIIDVDDIVGNSVYEHIAGYSIATSTYYFVELGFLTDTSFTIGNIASAAWTAPCIYKIVGIKY